MLHLSIAVRSISLLGLDLALFMSPARLLLCPPYLLPSAQCRCAACAIEQTPARGPSARHVARCSPVSWPAARLSGVHCLAASVS